MALELLNSTTSALLFVMLLSFLVSLATSTTNRLITNRQQLRDWNKEITQWRSESMKAARSGDKKLMARLKKQEKHVMQLQSKMMWQSMKTTLFWMIPMLLLWYVLLPQLIEVSRIVAYLPWLGSIPMPLNVILWYLLCSFLAGIIFNKVFGLGLGVE